MPPNAFTSSSSTKASTATTKRAAAGGPLDDDDDDDDEEKKQIHIISDHEKRTKKRNDLLVVVVVLFLLLFLLLSDANDDANDDDIGGSFFLLSKAREISKVGVVLARGSSLSHSLFLLKPRERRREETRRARKSPKTPFKRGLVFECGQSAARAALAHAEPQSRRTCRIIIPNNNVRGQIFKSRHGGIRTRNYWFVL